MKVSYNIYDFFSKELIETRHAEVNQITPWRKGLCICIGNAPDPNYHIAYIVNEQHEAIFYKSSRDSGCCWKSGYCLERVFGGFYVAYEGRCNARTFPGKDRETEYSYYKVITNVITEDGHLLSYEMMNKFLKKNKVRPCRDLFDGIVLCDNATYKLDDYSLINELPENSFVDYKKHDGYYKVEMRDDYSKLYVVVKSKRIIRYFKEKDFIDVMSITHGFIPEKHESKPLNPDCPPANTTTTLFECKIKEIIKDYYYIIDPKSGINAFSNIPSFLTDHPDMIQHPLTYSGFIKIGKIWYHLDMDNIKSVVRELVSKYFPLKNYITDIKYLCDIKFENTKCKLFKFDCEPFGIIDSHGVVHYDFNVNNIIWH